MRSYEDGLEACGIYMYVRLRQASAYSKVCRSTFKHTLFCQQFARPGNGKEGQTGHFLTKVQVTFESIPARSV